MYDFPESDRAGGLYEGRMSHFLDTLGEGVITPSAFVVQKHLETKPRPYRYKMRLGASLPRSYRYRCEYSGYDSEFGLGEFNGFDGISGVVQLGPRMWTLASAGDQGDYANLSVRSIEQILGKTSGLRTLPSVVILMDRERERLAKQLARVREQRAKFDKRQSELRRVFNTVKVEKVRRLERLLLYFDRLLRKYGGKFKAPMWDLERKLKDARNARFVAKEFKPRPYVFKYYNFLTGTALRRVVPPQSPTYTTPLPVHHCIDKWGKSVGTLSYTIDERVTRTIPLEMLREEHLTEVVPIMCTSYRPEPGLSVRSISRLAGWSKSPEYDEAKLFAAIQSCVQPVEKIVDLPVFIYELADIGKSIGTFRKTWRNLTNVWVRIRAFLRSDSAWGWRRLKPGTPAFKRLVGDGIGLNDVRAYGILEAAQTLSGQDLERKFGSAPATRDALLAANAVLSCLSDGHKVLSHLLKDRCKELSYHRIFDETLRTNVSYEALPDFLNLHRPAEGNQFTDFTVSDYTGPRLAQPDGDWYGIYSQRDRLIRDRLGGIQCTRRTTVKTVYRVTSLISFLLSDEFGRPLTDDAVVSGVLMDRLGLNINPKALWDMVPFSFVVDWLFNIGGLLDRLTVRRIKPDATLHGVILSRKISEQSTLTVPPFTEVDSGIIYDPENCGEEAVGSYRREVSSRGLSLEYLGRRYDRWILEPGLIIERGEIPLVKPPRWRNLLTGLELLH